MIEWNTGLMRSLFCYFYFRNLNFRSAKRLTDIFLMIFSGGEPRHSKKRPAGTPECQKLSQKERTANNKLHHKGELHYACNRFTGEEPQIIQ